MIVTIKSQCDKKALTETRRILDQYFERAGDRSWEGPITMQGLITVRKLLRKNARKNTAIACHRVRGTQRLELEWIIGNRKRFNYEGRVPTNTTSADVLRTESENQWHTLEAISLLASIAGLFHDFGKANALFQKKLKGKRGLQEPLRHEWLSLLVFKALIQGKTDEQWLQQLSQISEQDEEAIIAELKRFQLDRNLAINNPFVGLPPVATAVGWLIVSHHGLPLHPKSYRNEEQEEVFKLKQISLEELKISSNKWDASWNSRQHVKSWEEKEWKELFTFPQGSPIKSPQWRARTKKIASRALKYTGFLSCDWLEEDNFTSHLARLSLMLADHSFSALPPSPSKQYQNQDYPAFANTYKDNDGERKLKQRLDEHNIGVSSNAFLLAKQLPKIREDIPALGAGKALAKRTAHPDYRWQNKAYELSQSIAERTEQQGFFGVNMASTGKGKTFANARIMYGVSNAKRGCRFTVALGLRTLTLQTGDALRERLQLDTDDLAVLVGSQAVQELHEQRKVQPQKAAPAHLGSESAEDLMGDDQHIIYDGSLDSGPLYRWLSSSINGKESKALKLLSAPVLVATIDHLMPATEGVRGGKQIAPMLRLLTSDLVLDEPDDFGTEDLPALCRLVNWAGLLGSKVLLSSASLPPVMVRTLFDAYLAGRKQYDKACGQPGKTTQVCCAWFDEFSSTTADCGSVDEFKVPDRTFVGHRILQLNKDNQPEKALRKGAIQDVSLTGSGSEEVITSVVEALNTSIQQLHINHYEVDSQSHKQVSLGLIRIANINSLAAIARTFASTELDPDWQYHICAYHSQFPLLVRSHIEARLDSLLDRHDTSVLWQQKEIRQALDNSEAKNQVFIVLGSPVTEVGRDHDYSWAVAEPSSMRSIIQLAGRVQRHRKEVPLKPNVLVLEKNIRALKGGEVAYCKPGFETLSYVPNRDIKDAFILKPEFKSLKQALLPSDIETISSIPRIEQRAGRNAQKNMVDLEHAHLNAALRKESRVHLRSKKAADYWWNNPFNLTWSAEMQRHTPFRHSLPDEAYVLYQDEETEPAIFCLKNDLGELIPMQSNFEYKEVTFTKSVQPWIETTMEALLAIQAEKLDQEVSTLSKRFGEIRLPKPYENNLELWSYHPWLGVYRTIK